MRVNKSLIFTSVATVFVLTALSVGGYLFIHSKEPMLRKEGGNDYYTKGMVYERTLFGWTTYSGDVCSGDEVKEKANEIQEKIVNKDNDVIGRYYVSYESFKCPNGCANGACIR